MADSVEVKWAVFDRSHRMVFQINIKSRAESLGFLLYTVRITRGKVR